MESTPLNLLRKLSVIQRAVLPRKDKTANITTTFSYKYVTLSALWEQIESHMEELGLYFGWYEDGSHFSSNVLVTYVVDLETGEKMESRRILHNYKTTVTKDVKDYKTKDKIGETVTEETDFRSEGAELSYWKRMGVLTLLGMITSDDVDAEESSWAKHENGGTQQKSTTTKGVVF